MAESTQPAVNQPSKVTNEVKRHWGWFLAVGIATVLLGIAALAFPWVATLAVELLVGWILVLYGVLGVIHALRNARWNGYLFSLFGALLALCAGALLVFYPMTGVLSLTLLIVVFFLAAGTFRVLLALRLRPADHWGWLLVSGLLAITLAILIVVQWPEAAAWIIGLMLGIDLIFAGSASILLAMAARNL